MLFRFPCNLSSFLTPFESLSCFPYLYLYNTQ
nr:MAG TPA: hypothetical protein [Caudoviricetes sp.]